MEMPPSQLGYELDEVSGRGHEGESVENDSPWRKNLGMSLHDPGCVGG